MYPLRWKIDTREKVPQGSATQRSAAQRSTAERSGVLRSAVRRRASDDCDAILYAVLEDPSRRTIRRYEGATRQVHQGQ